MVGEQVIVAFLNFTQDLSSLLILSNPRYYTLHYYLADDTVEMLENLPRNHFGTFTHIC